MAAPMTDAQNLFGTALEMLVDKVQADPCVLAAVLLGSMAYDAVWQRSDIDLLLVIQESPRKKEGLCLVECGVNVHCMLLTRSEFRKILEGSVQGSFMHSLLLKGRMLFSRDEPLRELFESRHGLGERDRSIQLLKMVSHALPGLAKAEKWFHVRKDYTYCSFWILKCVDSLASIEVLLHDEVPSREVIHQALRLNPALFRAIYTDLLEGIPSPLQLESALAGAKTYLRSHVDDLFSPILSYLEEEGALRSMTDINHHFLRHFGVESVDSACEWLADEGYLHKLATPVRVTDKSHVEVEEAAYYCAADAGR